MRFALQAAVYIVVGTIACVVAAALLYQRWANRKSGMSPREFAEAFSESGIPKYIPAAVYDFYLKSVFLKNLKVAPDDRYEDMLKGGQEIEDDARSLMKRLGLRPPPEGSLAEWASASRAQRGLSVLAPDFNTRSASWTQPILTIRDMVLWLDWVRRNQPS